MYADYASYVDSIENDVFGDDVRGSISSISENLDSDMKDSETYGHQTALMKRGIAMGDANRLGQYTESIEEKCNVAEGYYNSINDIFGFLIDDQNGG